MQGAKQSGGIDNSYPAALFSSMLILLCVTTVMIEIRIMTALAMRVPAQVVVMVLKIGEAALNMV